MVLDSKNRDVPIGFDSGDRLVLQGWSRPTLCTADSSARNEFLSLALPTAADSISIRRRFMQSGDAMFGDISRKIWVHFDSVDGGICVPIHRGVADRVRI